MAKSVWRMDRDGQWVKDAGGKGKLRSGRPNVAGASASMAPGSTVVPCPLASIKVTVMRADTRRPIHGAVVHLSGPGAGQLDTDRAGLASFTQVVPGTYQVSVSIPTGRPPELVEPPACPDVEVASSSTNAVIIMVEPLDRVGEDKQEHTTCIEINLVGYDGSPVPHEPFEITFPNGRVEKGWLNAEGVAWYGLAEPGECELRFPELDDDAWEAISSVVPCGLLAARSVAEGTWIEISLVGDDGLPVPHEAYEITFANGHIEKGRLNAEGVAWSAAAEPGACLLSFPELADAAWKAI